MILNINQPLYLLYILCNKYVYYTVENLHLDSHHNLSAKYSVSDTLIHRAETVFSNPQLLQEEKYIRGTLQRWKYPNWKIPTATHLRLVSVQYPKTLA